MRRRILSVLVCLAALAVMLGLGTAGRRNTADAIGIGVIMGEAVRVRQAPSRTADIVAVLRGGLEVTVLAEENDFYQIIAEIEGEEREPDVIVEGYVKAELISLEKLF